MDQWGTYDMAQGIFWNTKKKKTWGKYSEEILEDELKNVYFILRVCKNILYYEDKPG